MRMKELRIKDHGNIYCVQAEEDSSLLDVFRAHGIRVPAVCGGQGTCGKCRVKTDIGEVLACRTYMKEIHEAETIEEGSGLIQDMIIAETGPGNKQGTGAAVDLGTTTIVVKVFDLESGKELGTQSAWNDQRSYGADVISRIKYCMDHPDGLQTLQNTVNEQIEDMIRHIVPEVTETVIAGNTVMEHIAAGISPVSIAQAPYRPETLFQEKAEGPVQYMPCAAGYVGGDITAGLLACDLLGEPGTTLFLDIGTNGEMVLYRDGRFLCCAAASGPAFEGADISCGMPAVSGAVSRVTMDDSLHMEVIGNTEARGICGSGLLDLIAVLLEEGVIDSFGRLLPPDEAPEAWTSMLEEDENGNGRLRINEQVFLSAADVRQVQLAKGAVAAGSEILLRTAGINADDVSRVILAGGFGSKMDPRSAEIIGMMPEGSADKTVPAGDTALAGAVRVLLNEEEYDTLKEILSRCTYIELSGHPDFNRIFTEKMLFGEEEELWN